jgi:hypothetical protein
MELILLLVVIAGACVVVRLSGHQGATDRRVDEVTTRLERLQDELALLHGSDEAAMVRAASLEAALADVRLELGRMRSTAGGGELATSRGEPAASSAEAGPTPASIATVPSSHGPAQVDRRPAPSRRRPAEVPGWQPPGRAASHPAVRSSEWQPELEPQEVPVTLSSQPGPGPWIALRPLLERGLAALGLESPSAGTRPSRAALEAWLEGRLLAVVGGVALLLGAAFFLSLAFSRGWITEPMRVLIGLGVGAALLVLGELALGRLRGIVGPVLVAVGLAIVTLALFASTRLYGLVDVEWALAGAFVAAIAAAVIAVRHDSQLVAAFGLISVLAAPPVLGAGPTIVTLLFVAAILIGTTAIALFRTWAWLPPIAFVLAAPQVASYVTGPPPVVDGLVVVAGFWLVNLVASGGEEFRRPSDRLRTSTVTLLLVDAAFSLWAGFVLLVGDAAAWRGTFVAVGAAAYLAIGLTFIVRNGDRHPFGLVVTATGIAALTMAVPIQAGGPPVPVAWAAEAAALAWVASLRRHPYSAAVSLLLGAMAIGHLVAVEFPPADIVTGYARPVPFADPEGWTFGFVLAALGVAALGVPVRWIRAALATVGAALATYVSPFELSGPALVAGWSAIAAAGSIGFVRIVAPRIAPTFRERRVRILALPRAVERPVAVAVMRVSALVRPLFVLSALVAGAAALGHLILIDYPILSIGAGTPHDMPFVALPGLAYGIVLVALVITGLVVPTAWIRVSLTALGGLITWYVLPFELSGPALVWAWSVLATAAFALEGLIVGPRLAGSIASGPRPALVRASVVGAGGLAGAAAVGHLIVFDFPIGQLGQVILSVPPYRGPEGLALAAVLLGLLVSAWALRAQWVRLGAAGIAGMLVAYTLTFEVRQPEVMVTWAVLALGSLAVVRRLRTIRLVPAPFPRQALLRIVGERLPYLAAGLAVAFEVASSYRLADARGFIEHVIGSQSPAGTPFLDERSSVLVVLAATLAAAGWVWRGTMAKVWGAIAASGVMAWLLPFEVPIAWAIAGWCGLALAGIAAIRTVPQARTVLGSASLALAGSAALVALTIVAPPDRLVVDAGTSVTRWGPLTDATVALGAMVVGLGVGAWLHRSDRLAPAVAIAAGVVGVYLLSVAVVDWFQVQVDSQPLEDLQKSASVGLTVLWSVLGGAAFAAGLVTKRTPLRLFGLALLGLATVKVFLVDLAALDVAYRVLSLVALGALLLISAAVYSRLQHPHGPASHRPA